MSTSEPPQNSAATIPVIPVPAAPPEAISRLVTEFGRLFPVAPSVPAPAPAGEAAAGAVPAPAPAPVPAPRQPGCLLADFAAKGYHLDVLVSFEQVVAAANLLDREGFALDAITGVDWIADKQMEVVYDYFHFTSPARVMVRARLPRENPEIQTISGVFAGANWHERETHDFFGIKFAGHPNLIPILLPEDATFHPLKKDFVA
ncbi:MAG: NADH-quinone oxidoreductase subunit C [Verrucomicrobiota bacterium]